MIERLYFPVMSTPPVFEFHVSRAARDRYSFDETIFAFDGNVVFPNPVAARQFATRMNVVRGVERDPVRAARPADLYAMGLIDEALHAVVATYRRRHDKRVMSDAVQWFQERLGAGTVQGTLLRFLEEFPPVAVYKRTQTAEEWLGGETGGLAHRDVAMEEMLMLWVANSNHAYRPYAELFDESRLGNTAYREIVSGFREYFETRPRIGSLKQNLIDVLRAPATASPESLAGQLAFLRQNFSHELEDYLQQILTALDVIKEEEIAIWTLFHPPDEAQQRHFGAPQDMGDSSAAAVPSFSGKEPEYERFSPDVHWMPNTVLLAKTVYVWLDQLSRAYGRHIHRLDHVPDEELALMSRRGFNALWLIGIWERSAASRRIKQLTGNPDAAASAYSLHDYQIAGDLGGQEAYENLRDRAVARGIRLASDMVPNHMGIDSRWVIEHPDWFVSLPHSPYPAYSFNGPDLSSDHRVEIKIEDHYYDRTDAAVVFRRVDRWSGDTRYVYHGNDGTTFPWNDTAQLNYLNPEVREAVIQTIIHVARMFPIIRFDAAMTLTKQHYQRLWYPVPGTGGAIPSRAEHGLTKQQFDAAMPNEFWREVVDRIAVEVPGTLLLAEAFWLLEGYFVRTLGMHRVYNSAFMNMLRDEENANYRSVLKNTLEFDPDVLKRYVNFMNNPDERTAVDQFGKGDKYFGVCILLSTLPGLPMFGHGQIEGFTERYGMEFRRALRDEHPDAWLVGRHEREITPLLHRRALFADVQEFLLYDFYADNGTVNEDVFAYSNRLGDQRALVVYHNRYADTSGWVRISCAYAEKQPDGSKRTRQRSIGEAFGFSVDPKQFVAYRDSFTGQEYLRRAGDIVEQGLHLRLGAYESHVFLDWREMRDDASHPWSQLCDYLGGRGVPSLDEALVTLQLKPLHDSLLYLLEPEVISAFASENVRAVQSDEVEEEAESLGRTSVVAKEAKEAETLTASGEEEGNDTESALAQDTESEALDEQVSLDDLTRRAERVIEQLALFAQRQAEQSPAKREKPVEPWNKDAVLERFREAMQAATLVPTLEDAFAHPWPEEARLVLPGSPHPKISAQVWGTVIAWALLDAVSRVADALDPEQHAVSLFDNARLRQPLADALGRLGSEGEDRWRAVARVRFAFAHAATAHVTRAARGKSTAALSWLHDPEVAWLIGTHDHQGVSYFNKELFERLIWWMALRSLVEVASEPTLDEARVREIERDLELRCQGAKDAGYRVEELLELGTVL